MAELSMLIRGSRGGIAGAALFAGTVGGSGRVLATRQEFYAFVEGDHGWYQPSKEGSFEIRTLTPNNEPVATRGEVVVRRISYVSAGDAREDVIKRWMAETDVQGRLSFRY